MSPCRRLRSSHNAELAVEQAQFYASAARGRPRFEAKWDAALSSGTGEIPTPYDLSPGAPQYAWSGVDRGRRPSNGSAIRILAHSFGRATTSFPLLTAGAIASKWMVSRTWWSATIVGIVRAPSPAVVVSIAVKPGDMVAAGDRLAVLEAMKMEMQVVAPFSGKSSPGYGDSQCAGVARRSLVAD